MHRELHCLDGRFGGLHFENAVFRFDGGAVDGVGNVVGGRRGLVPPFSACGVSLSLAAGTQIDQKETRIIDGFNNHSKNIQTLSDSHTNPKPQLQRGDHIAVQI